MEHNYWLNGWLKGMVVATALVSGVAQAGTVTNPALVGSATISDGTSSGNWNLGSGALYTDNGDGTFTYNSGVSGTLWNFNWDLTVSPDPFISGTLTVVNKSVNTTHFNILFTLPVGTGFAPAFKSGSMSGSFQDFNGNGLGTNNTAGLSNVVWYGLIDGSNALSLSTFDVSCSGSSPCSGTVGPVSDGPLLHSAGVSSTIGMQLSFDLTAGDKATFTNLFEVTPVPIPAAVWLFGSGLIGLGGLARRRRSI